jgi:dTDP-4-amino-4,6-dideoxy-D-galactose acyltransferase
LVTLKQNKDVGKIGIIAVDENYRGRELGKKLLQGADKWYFEKGLTEAEVVTQQTNPSACRFYERNGYSVKQVEYVYHVWK